jgi:hypothetical protein
MSAVAGIWLLAALAYAAFYVWYVGFRRPLTAAEVDALCQELATHWSAERLAPVAAFLRKDTGCEFFMANLVQLRRHTASCERGAVAMQRYQAPFLKAILRRGCHPIAVGIAASSAVECWGVENGGQWSVAALVRYRSRRDLAEVLLSPHFQDIHRHKEDAVEKTIAFATDPAYLVGGGPKWTVPLVLLVIALLATLTLR